MKSVYIVKLNWLEDSLLSKSGKPLDTAKYQWEQKKVTKCGIKKRKRSDDDEGVEDGNEAKEARSTKRARKRKQTDAEGAAASKDKRIEKAGECWHCCHELARAFEADTTQERNSTRHMSNSRNIWATVSVH